MSDLGEWIQVTFVNYLGLGDSAWALILFLTDRILSKKFPNIMKKGIPMRRYILLSLFFLVVLFTSFISWNAEHQKVSNKQSDLYVEFAGERIRRIETYRSMWSTTQQCVFDSTALNYTNDVDPSLGGDLWGEFRRVQAESRHFEEEGHEENANFAKILKGIKLSFDNSSRLDSIINTISILPKYEIIKPTKHDIVREKALEIWTNHSNKKLEKFIQREVVNPLNVLDKYLQQEIQNNSAK
jgi:hypothetical protein